MQRSRVFVITVTVAFIAGTVLLFTKAGLTLGERIFIEPWLQADASWNDRAIGIIPAIVVALLALRILRALSSQRQALRAD